MKLCFIFTRPIFCFIVALKTGTDGWHWYQILMRINSPSWTNLHFILIGIHQFLCQQTVEFFFFFTKFWSDIYAGCYCTTYFVHHPDIQNIHVKETYCDLLVPTFHLYFPEAYPDNANCAVLYHHKYHSIFHTVQAAELPNVDVLLPPDYLEYSDDPKLAQVASINHITWVFLSLC